MAIDDDFKIWQRNEEPIDIFKITYQSLKPLVLLAAGRARAKAEWNRKGSDKLARGPIEIDSELSQVSKKLNDEEQGIVRTVLAGGNQARKEIAEFNQDCDNVCTYCLEAESTSDHICFECSFFKSNRIELDKDLVDIPLIT